MFERFSHRRSSRSAVIANDPDQVQVVAPVSGTIVALESVRDAAFSSGALGRGVAIVPAEGHFTAPIAGRVISLLPHAVGLESEQGVQVLIHIGIDTVNLHGKGFALRTSQGASVVPGDILVEVDLESVARAGFDAITMVTIVNAKILTGVSVHEAGPVDRGDVIVAASADGS